MATEERDLGTDEVLEQGDALLRSSRDLLDELDRRLGSDVSPRPVHDPGDSLRTNAARPGDS